MQAWTSSAGNAAALSLFRASSLLSRVSSDAAYIDEPEEKAIPPLLESRYSEEKVEGLKRTIALINLGKDVSEYFPQVVKNVAVPSLEVKKLVYMYLVHYAEKKPDEALLAINTLQKDLSNPDPIVRALALRALTGIRVRIAAPLAVIAVQKCSRDASAYVRRSAAHAVLKLHALDPVQYGPPMIAVLETLLGDSSPSVVGAAAAALRSAAPENLGGFARHFPRLCQMLPDLEEWGQIVMLDALLRCARLLFPSARGVEEASVVGGNIVKAPGSTAKEPWLEAGTSGLMEEDLRSSAGGESSGQEVPGTDGVGGGLHGRSVEERSVDQSGYVERTGRDGKPLDRRKDGKDTAGKSNHSKAEESFYSDSDSRVNAGLPRIVSPDSTASLPKPFQGAAPASESTPPQLRLLLHCSFPLLTSRNSGVVLGAAVLHWHVAPSVDLPRVVKPLTFLLRSSARETQYLALCAIATMAKQRPSLFGGEVRRFFVRPADPRFVRTLKLEILTTIAVEGSVDPILKELQVYVTDPDPLFIASIVRALGKLARRLPTAAVRCVQGLLSLALGGRIHTATPDASGAEPLEGVDSVSASNQRSRALGAEESTAIATASSSDTTRGAGSGFVANQGGREQGPLGAKPSADGSAVVSGSGKKFPAEREPQPTPQDAPFHIASATSTYTHPKFAPVAPRHDAVVSESVAVLCGLVRERPQELESAGVALIAGLERVRVSDARAAIVALVGDMCGRGGVWARVAPVVLRFMVEGFVSKEAGEKLAVLELASKYWLSLPSDERPRERPLMHHAFTLAKYDSNVDIRDRARFLRNLLNVHDLAFPTGRTPESSGPDNLSSAHQGQLSGDADGDKRVVPVFNGQDGAEARPIDGLSDEELVRRLLLRGKPVARPAQIAPDRSSFLVGTMSHVVNHKAPGYQPLPEAGTSRETFGIVPGVDNEDGRGIAAGAGRVAEAESSEYSESYDSSEGEAASESGASEDSVSSESENGDGNGSSVGIEAGRSEEPTGGVVGPPGLGTAQPVEQTGDTRGAGSQVAGTPEDRARGDPAIATTQKTGLETIVPALTGVGNPDLLGDLLSNDDLESWLGSLTVNESKK